MSVFKRNTSFFFKQIQFKIPVVALPRYFKSFLTFLEISYILFLKKCHLSFLETIICGHSL